MTANIPSLRCLASLVTYYDRVNTPLLDEGKVTENHLPLFVKSINNVPHNILVSKLKRHGFDRWTTRWIRIQLDGHTQRIAVNSFPVMVVRPQDKLPWEAVAAPSQNCSSPGWTGLRAIPSSGRCPCPRQGGRN